MPGDKVKAWPSEASPLLSDDPVRAGQKSEMKRQLESATDAPPELESQDRAESTPELLNANDAALQAPIHGHVSIPEWHGVGAQAESLSKLRLLWAKRQLMLYWGLN